MNVPMLIVLFAGAAVGGAAVLLREVGLPIWFWAPYAIVAGAWFAGWFIVWQLGKRKSSGE
jgi:hypothetical protein